MWHEGDAEDAIADWVQQPLPYDGIPKSGDHMFDELPQHLRKPGYACVEQDESEEGVDCEDTCLGTACFDEGKGLVSLWGLLAPQWGAYALEPEE